MKKALVVVCALLTLTALLPATASANTDSRSTSCNTANTAPTPVAPDKLQPFLKLPFRGQDGRGSLIVSNGWLMSEDEIQYAGPDPHKSLDFEFTRQYDHGYGLPVLAAADGRAYFSYQYISGTWVDPQGVSHQIGLGGGLFVEVRHCNGWVTQYIHLATVAKGLPYLAPERALDETNGTMTDWFPAPILQDNQTLWSIGVPVKAGQVIGYQGDTGVGLDWKDNFDVKTGAVAPRDRKLLKPWDPPQTHFQLYGGRVDGAKQNVTDPSGLYAQITASANPYTPCPGNFRLGDKQYWLLDRHRQPLYAG